MPGTVTTATALQIIKKYRPDTTVRVSGEWLVHSCIIDAVDPHHRNHDLNPSAEMNSRTGVYLCFAYSDEAIGFRRLCHILGERLELSSDRRVDEDDFARQVSELLEPALPRVYDLNVFERCTHPYMVQARGFSQRVLDEAGIRYDQFSGRIAIPVFDASGDCIAIQRRVIPHVCLDGKAHPKYEWTPGFDKSDHLYHVGQLDHSRPLLVVESAMSVLRAWDYGLTNCVATFGSHMSDRQADMVRGFDEVMLWYDGDRSGQSGIRQAIPKLLGCRLTVVDALGYDGQDIADLPLNVTKRLLASAQTPEEWLLTHGNGSRAFLHRAGRGHVRKGVRL